MKNLCLILGTVTLVITLLFVGLYKDNEFHESSLFTKYRPTFKIVFYSPIGMQDLELNDLTLDGRKEEIAFQEFVIKRGIQKDGDKLWFIPYVLIQLTLTLLVYGFIKVKFKKQQLALHFCLNFILTILFVTLILAVKNPQSILFITIFILASNIFCSRVLSNKSYA